MEDTRLQSFPFDSKNSGYDDYGYPVYDRAVGASMLKQTFAEFFSNGVFGTPGTAFEISKGEGLRVIISEGLGIINGNIASVPEGGISVKLTDDTTTKGTYAYGVFLRSDENSDKRSCYITVRAGEAGPNPTPPDPDRTAPGIWELRLGYVVVPTGATDLSGATITNEKGGTFCPYALPFAEIDLSALTNDARKSANEALTSLLAYFDQYEDMVAAAVDGTLAGQLQNQITEIKEQLDNFDLSGSVDNETIAYSQKPGDSKKTLHLVDIPDGIITSNKISNGSVTLEKLSKDVIDKIDEIIVGLDINAYSLEELSTIVYDESIPTEVLEYLVGHIIYVTISGYGNIAFQVIGVRHDDLSDGSGKAGLTFQSVPCIATHNMNSSNTTTGGWESTSMRSWLNSTIYNAIPSELKPYVKKVKKKYCATTTYSDVSTCDDYLFLASYMEVFGQSSYGEEGTRYQYWSLHNSNDDRIKYLNNSAQYWWLRSVFSSEYFMRIGTNGTSSSYGASSLIGASPCFCI